MYNKSKSFNFQMNQVFYLCLLSHLCTCVFALFAANDTGTGMVMYCGVPPPKNKQKCNKFLKHFSTHFIPS